jgi:hypothetical protein
MLARGSGVWKVPGSVAAVFALACVFAWAPDSASAAVCDDFSNQREAQEAANTRDADGDGIYCEALPCPCLKPGESSGGGGGSEPLPPPEPPKLEKAAAKRAARSRARRFVRRNPSLDRARLNRCSRRTKYEVSCRFSASGKVGARVTNCSLKVVVRGEGSTATAKLRARCSSFRRLTAAMAVAAMRVKAEDLAGKPAELLGVSRRSNTAFEAEARWTRSEPAFEECAVSLTARLGAGIQVEAVAGRLECIAT